MWERSPFLKVVADTAMPVDLLVNNLKNISYTTLRVTTILRLEYSIYITHKCNINVTHSVVFCFYNSFFFIFY